MSALTQLDAPAFLAKADAILESATAKAVLAHITRETLANGDSRTTHKGHGLATGKGRRTIDSVIKTLKRLELIERIGTTSGGSAVYRATFSAGA